MTRPLARREDERGAALLTVLLLVSVIAVIAATALDKLLISTRLAANAATVQQARAYMISAEAIAASRIEDLLERNGGALSLAGGWMNEDRGFAVPGGEVRARLIDTNNCFNLNSLVKESSEGYYSANPRGASQFVALLTSLDIGENDARLIAATATDWIDSDRLALSAGAEDSEYRSESPSYLPANRLFAHPSELRVVRYMTPEIWERVSPWVCALPVAELSPINVNTLLPEQAPLLAMAFPEKLSVDAARTYLASRPASGYGSITKFWNGGPMAEITPSRDVNAQLRVRSQWFLLEMSVDMADSQLTETALFDARHSPVRLLWRSWSEQ